jgi:hypothetical protein
VPGAIGNAHAGNVYTLAVDVDTKFQEEEATFPGTRTCKCVIGEDPVLLIVSETNPPPFQVEESAKEMPALQVPLEPLLGEGFTGVVPEPLELLVDVEVEDEDTDEDELDELEDELTLLEDELPVLLIAEPAVHWEVEHWH